LIRQLSRTLPNGRLVPNMNLAEIGIQLQWALFKAAFHVALLDEGSVTVLGVVTRKCQIS
jgi:hypothetical protein